MYKVVTNRNGLLGSSYVQQVKELNVEYKVGEWVRPNVEGTKLFVFSRLDDAKNFIVSNEDTVSSGRMQIYTCSVLNPVYKYDKYIPSLLEISIIVNRIKKHQLCDLSSYLYSKADPAWPNTIYCDAVKLLELVPHEDSKPIC